MGGAAGLRTAMITFSYTTSLTNCINVNLQSISDCSSMTVCVKTAIKRRDVAATRCNTFIIIVKPFSKTTWQ